MNGRWKGGRIQDGNGYWQILLSPDDPYFVMANARGYVLEYRLVVAKRLKRSLASWECVHHKDGNKGNNNFKNLELLKTQEHNGISALERKIRKLTHEITRLKKEYSDEIDEFNSGFSAFEKGELIENEPSHTPYDVWKIGWVWASYVADAEKSGARRALESVRRSASTCKEQR